MGRTAAAVLFSVVVFAPLARRHLPGMRRAPSSPAAPRISEPSTPATDIQFLLRDSYEVGDRIAVRIENVGKVAYGYQPYYQACFVPGSFFPT